MSEIAAQPKEPPQDKLAPLVNEYVAQALSSMNNTADLFPKDWIWYIVNADQFVSILDNYLGA